MAPLRDIVIVLVILAGFVDSQGLEAGVDFAPVVTATCKAGFMTIRINFNQSFTGIAHARDFRTPPCMSHGNGSNSMQLGINLLASFGAADYCGVLVNNKTEERSVPLAVRVHRTLELADDKFYVITCGKAGFRNAKNETSLVSLKVVTENGRRVSEALYGNNYILRADLSKPDGSYGIRVKSCFAFNKHNSSVPLIDERGCSANPVISAFTYDVSSGRADAVISSMFRFPDSSQVNFQCDVAICKGGCVAVDCSSANVGVIPGEDGSVSASANVFVLDPGELPRVSELCNESTVHPTWLLYLAIALGVMFLIMLIINCFLCSAMTCSCARTEVLEKDSSVVEDYDPYRSWHGSQYGSRYPSSTIHSARSVSDNSDHYAIVQSRPGSRHSGAHRSRH
ncbi:uncharacterized protein LOC143914302 [Arctopsyche grandis]|uniref:uncharacterized protein LOC143914302 n=1 Tax=Arctopsyche grandis TaxID=121162 RepID=UPI00406D87AF